MPLDIADYVEVDPTSPSGLRWKVKRGPVFPGDPAGNVQPNLYYQVCINYKKMYTHRVVWELVNGPIPPKMEIDHIDGNRQNNDIANLRLATHSNNKWNTTKRSNNTSGFKGVTWFGRTKKWHARIRCHGKNTSLGYHNTPEEAHAAYCKAASELHGQFAKG